MEQALVFQNPALYQADGSLRHVECVVVKDRKIVHIGELTGEHTGTVIDCRGKVLAKSFCDHHYHLPGSKLYDLFGANLSTCGSVEEYGEALKAVSYTGGLIRAFGWTVEVLSQYFAHSEQTPLQWIDALFPEQPAVLFSADFHSCWCNSTALRALYREGIDCAFADQEVAHGNECILHEKIAEQIFASERFCFSEEEIRQAILAQQEELLEVGITEINTLLFIGTSYWSALNVLRQLDEEGLLHIQINFAYTASPSEHIHAIRENVEQSLSYQSRHLRLAAVKVYLDGVIDNHSAYLKADYADSPGRGACLWEEAALEELIRCSLHYGLPVHVHGIGDAAVEAAVDAMAKLPKPDMGRHIIAHVQLCDPETIRNMAAHDITACLQPFWFYRGREVSDLDSTRLGDRARTEYPAKSLLEAGVKLLFGSDCPATVGCDPLQGIRRAAHDDGSGEHIPLWEGYKAYYSGTYEEKGVELREGAPATFVLFREDPCQSSRAELLSTYVEGNCVWTR